MNSKINKKMQKALKNESFVNYINQHKARFLRHQDMWGGSNLQGFIEDLAKCDEDCCDIPSSAFKAYVENEEEDWKTSLENKEKNPMLYEIYNLIEEKEDDLYLAMSEEWEDDLDICTPEEAASQLSSYYKITNNDYTDEWLESIKLACKGYDFSDEALIG